MAHCKLLTDLLMKNSMIPMSDRALISIDGAAFETIFGIHAFCTADGATNQFTGHRSVLDRNFKQTATIEFEEIWTEEGDDHILALSEDFYAEQPALEGCTIKGKLL